MKRYLFELCVLRGGVGYERRSIWISDAWLTAEVSRNPNLNRVVQLPEAFLERGVTHRLTGKLVTGR